MNSYRDWCSTAQARSHNLNLSGHLRCSLESCLEGGSSKEKLTTTTVKVFGRV